MTVSTHTKAALVAGGDKDNNGGVIAHAGTVSGNNRQITSKSVLDLVAGPDHSGSTVILSADNTAASAHIPGIKAALVDGGTFAYNPANVTRSKTDTGFIMSHVPSLLAGKAATGDLMAIPAGHYTSSVAGNIHPKTFTYRKGLWSDTRFDLFTGKIVDADGDAKAATNPSGRGSSSNYTNLRGSGAIDDAAEKASAVRGLTGELVILFNFVDWERTTSPNMVDYSALTG